ncbi:putative immunity protein [Rubeoparvulum massiliense]|uniref:putative immunity protein n=1 Tax=Rubeoparvulum massiliense TaxID=1631346 RepID=UPI000AC75D4A|nr:hypothetical protein [Rubeoparvulum massiliense]
MPKARKMLSNWDAPYIQPLVKLIETQSKSTLAHWAVDYAERVLLPLWSKYYPDDLRPQNALIAAWQWLSGEIKLPEAKTAILECHAGVCLTRCVLLPWRMKPVQRKSTGNADHDRSPGHFE